MRTATTAYRTIRAVRPLRFRRLVRHRALPAAAALTLITLAGLWLRVVDLDRAGLGNLFYAATVRSMGESLHNFWFAAYDPAATLTVDKPPLGLWLQVLATKLLGYGGEALILPMALAGTAAIPLVFGAARRSADGAVALAAAALLAVFPESVATARDSTMDALVLAMLAGGAWLLVVAVEERRPGLLLAWAMLMGLAFNVKFFEGFVVLPAAATYLAVRWRDGWRTRWPAAARAAVAGVVVALAWVVAMDLTPRSARPRVMNDPANSVLGLALRYNGLERVLPGEVTVFAPIGQDAAPSAALLTAARAFGVGDRGPLRLLQSANGPLLGVTVLLALGGVALAARRRQWLADGPGLFWTLWLLTGLLLFSFSNRAAAHYVESFAPALAMMGGFGLVTAWRLRDGPRAAALPLGVALTALYAWWAVRGHEAIRDPTRIVAAGAAAVAALALVALLVPRLRAVSGALRALAAAAIVGVPAVASLWIAREAPRGGQITVPNPLVYARAGADPPAGRTVPAEAVLRLAGTTGARYAFAVDGINNAGEAIAFTGASVLPLWNEYRREPALPIPRIEALLADGAVPYVLLSRARIGAGLLADVLPVVSRHCRPVATAAIGRAWTLWRCTPTGGRPLQRPATRGLKG
jgi:4-amino-4-deoxy-L-arabinose transferase-like glycosyltransferase